MEAITEATGEEPIAYDETAVDRGHWFGYMTTQNAAALRDRLEHMLLGKRYTWVSVNENLDLLHPEVRTGERIEPQKSNDGVGIKLLTHETDGARGDEPWAHIMACCSYGVWGLATRVQTQREAHELVRATDRHGNRGAVGLHHMSDPELRGTTDRDVVYVSFEHDRQVLIQQRTGAGGRTTWTISVERDEHELRALILAARDALAELPEGDTRKALTVAAENARWELRHG